MLVKKTYTALANTSRFEQSPVRHISLPDIADILAQQPEWSKLATFREQHRESTCEWLSFYRNHPRVRLIACFIEPLFERGSIIRRLSISLDMRFCVIARLVLVLLLCQVENGRRSPRRR